MKDNNLLKDRAWIEISLDNLVNNINEITLTNLENGEVTLEQLNEIYNKMGFVFVANKGRFTKIRKEIKH